jgi:hypothetical protein
MSAQQAISAALRAGIGIEVDSGDLVLEAPEEIPADIIAGFKRHKPEIPRMLRAAVYPEPRIVREPPFGSDGVPERYRAAWQALLAQCPPSVTPYVWEAAIYDGADLFGWWGAELDRFHWPPGDLFDVPYDGRRGGLAWFIRGDPVVALGPAKAFTQARRVFERMRS